MSHKGSCLCGQLKWTIEGEPQVLAVCHCIPCRKTSSCSASSNFIVPRDKFSMQGNVKQFTRTGDSGKKVTYQYCTDCPTIIAVDAEAMPDAWIVKAGPCEDEQLLRGTKPGLEIYTKNRYPWVNPTGADEHESA